MTTSAPERTSAPTVDVDLDAVPMCERNGTCVGEQGPAVARLHIRHACDHQQAVLICEPCLQQITRNMLAPMLLLCRRCDLPHLCVAAAHVRVCPL